MSLRARLIVAFLILSIVPLSAMTLIWYVSSVRTFERAAEREASETAADIGRRMEMVTTTVGRRMDRLFDEAVGYTSPFDSNRWQRRSTAWPRISSAIRRSSSSKIVSIASWSCRV